MTLSYIEMMMLSTFMYSFWAALCPEKGWLERIVAIVCVICNIFVLSSKAWSMIQ